MLSSLTGSLQVPEESSKSDLEQVAIIIAYIAQPSGPPLVICGLYLSQLAMIGSENLHDHSCVTAGQTTHPYNPQCLPYKMEIIFA